MCVSGKVKYTGSGAANFTTDSEYAILALAPSEVSSGAACAIVVDDSGHVVRTGSLSGADFEVTSLTAPIVAI